MFGDDGSPGADVAWLWIINHSWPHWRLDIVAATGLPLPAGIGDPNDPEFGPAPERPQFAAAAFAATERLTPAQDPRVALSVPADLVVIGNRGPGVLKALRLGSTAEWLLVRPPAPVIVVRHGRPTRRVLLACDGSVHSAAAAAALCALPFVDRLHVDVVGVDDRHLTTDEAVADTGRRLRDVGADVETMVVAGEPTAVVADMVSSLRPDLLALGTRGHTGVTRIRLGSTAQTLIRQVDCSVLVARDPDEIEHGIVPDDTGADRASHIGHG